MIIKRPFPKSEYVTLLFVTLAGLVLQSGFQPKKNPAITKAALGKALFFDPILSGDSSVSCASCHKPEFAFADTMAFSLGVSGKKTRRNTPSVLNMANRDLLFWDGRAQTLEDQALFPIQDHDEMNLEIPLAIKRLKRAKRYKTWFLEAFGRGADKKALSEAIASYEATLETSESRFDLYIRNELEISADEKAGQKLFVGKAKCFDCHFSPDFTGDEFKNIGLFDGKTYSDSGRYRITHKPEDLGKFKVPGLRNVAITAPYMHDGSMKTLRQVIDYYNNPLAVVPKAINTDSTFAKGLNLSEVEKDHLEKFLNALTDKRFQPKN